MFIGYGLNGFFSGVLFVPIVPMVIETIENEEKAKDPNFTFNPKISDKTAAMIGMVYSLGQILSPIFGGYFTDHFGFQEASDCFMFFSLLVSLAYGLFLFKSGEKI